MRTILTIFIIAVCLFSCEKNKTMVTGGRGEILRFNPDKCMCCWGWDVKIGNDTIKIDSVPSTYQLAYPITAPVPVYIELGSKILDCSSLKKYDYYKVKRIEILK